MLSLEVSLKIDMNLVSKKYIVLALFFLISSVASSQIMLPAYHGVSAKQAVSSGGLNNALNFDGVNDYVSVNSSAALNITSNLSLSAWVYRNSSGKYDCIIGKDNYAGNNGYSLWIYDDDKLTLRFGNSRIYKSSTSIPSGTWVHVAGTFDGTNAKLYINGTLDSSYPASAPTSNSGGLYLGTPQDAVGNPLFNFSGTLEDIRIWNIALTQSAIQSSMNNELLGNEYGLVADYSFNQGIAGGDNTGISTITDKTANAFNGTLTNFTKNGASSNFVNGKFLSSIISSGLVLHLDAGNASSYPGSGTTWTDLSGNGYNGTLTNGPTYSSSNGGSIVFDGTDDVATLGNILNIGLNSWTLSCWVKFNNGTGLQGIIGKTSYRGYVGRYSFYIEFDNLHAFFQPDINYSITTPIAPYLDNKFHNLVMTIDRTSMMYFYIDGISVGTPLNVSGTSSINLNSSTDNFYIGSYGSSNGQSPFSFLNGNVSQASIYSRALTAAEVLENYNILRPRFGDVTNPTTGRIWMDRNLGATQVATSSTDSNAYGDLYQWGRGADGHQIRTSGTTSTLSSTDQPGNGNFILAPNSPFNWRSPQNTNLWQGVNGVNNPCPSGYRVPTEAEWQAEYATWTSPNYAFGSPLKLPKAGIRTNNNSLNQVGTGGRYWSSTVDGSNSRYMYFDGGSGAMFTDARALAASIRCIMN